MVGNSCKKYVLTHKYDFIKYDKYAFEKYNLFENTSTFL